MLFRSDGQSTAPGATHATVFTPDPDAPPGAMDTIGRKNALGPTSVGVPGNLKGWTEALAKHGTFSVCKKLRRSRGDSAG